jgi:C4-dicarboxylate-specific signal transduction histidine kinase
LELKRLKAMENIVEKSYGNYTLLAASICAAPVSAISLIDSDAQWFRAQVGLHLKGTARDISFCTHAILHEGVYIVNNAQADPLFEGNPLVTGEPRICFYAGAPLITSRGHNLGTLCVMDYVTRTLTPEQIQVLKRLADQIVIQLEESMNAANLSATLSRLHTFLDHMEFAALIEDEEGAVLYLNEAFRRMFPAALDLRAARIQVRRHSLIEDLQECFCRPKEFIQLVTGLMNERRKRSNHELRTLDGAILELDYIPTLDNEHYRGHIWLFRDVTEQRRVAQEIEQHKIQALHAEKLAILGEMAAGLAHEINNPLAIIQGQAHRLKLQARRHTLSMEGVESSVACIDATVARIVKIIQGLRAFARDDGQAELQMVRVQQIIDDALMFCESRIKNHGFHLRVTPFPADLSMICRPIPITQVLLQLLNNAFDACRMQDGGQPWIEIQVGQEADTITLRVVDSGPGIPRELVEKIMLPFFTTKEIGKGSGLGLSIAKGIAESHRGAFFFDQSAPHTTFVLQLPLAQAAAAPFDRPHN